MVTTMRDIARVAGVSQSTVSRVLNDAATSVPIAAETRERASCAAARGPRLSAQPAGARACAAPRRCSSARSSATSATRSSPARSRPWRSRPWRHGYNIVLGHAQGRLDEGIALTTVLETRHTDAIVLLGDMQDQPRLLDDLRALDRPGRGHVAGHQPARVPDRRARRPGRHPGRAGARRRPRATTGIAFVSAHLPGRLPASARTPTSSS